MSSRSAHQRRHLSSSPFNAEPTPQEIEHFTAGDRVTHDRYGVGTVLEDSGATVTVSFGSERVRIASPFTKLTKL
ncbi:ATP-binding protein [Intrasporangium oryzae NRRL B-24470]|uniref:ATP-binding protein n=1 Tax=Intrasporangium oryzae NRRL B-24470 TaxID=1386089 RepID=W9G7T6_9MICO|nr:hypothetical protein [Intrasporangium oryzae]EWT00883.1 ATP-binding protein [Intrasporangium oryzae NRRL B-24470]